MKVRSAIEPQEIEIIGNFVYVASNITPYAETVDGRVNRGYEYECEKYSKDEYLIKLARENANLKQEIIDTQLALVELYEAGDIE